MQDFEHIDLPEDDEVEISDLDTPDERKNSSPIYRILERAREIHLSPRTRIRLFVLALLLGGSVLAYQFIPSPRSKTTSVGYISSYSSIHIVTNPIDPAVNISVANGIAYIFTQDGTLNAQRASDGKLLWQSKVSSSSSQPVIPPTLANNLILFTSENSTGSHVDALRASDGILEWSFQTSTLASPAPLTVMVEDAITYILTQNGTIYALNVNNGHLLWKFATRLSMPLANLLYSSNGVTAVLSDTNTAYLLRTQDGSIDAWRGSDRHHLWHYQPSTPVTQETATDGMVYMQQEDGTISVLQAQDGKVAWSYPNAANP